MAASLSCAHPAYGCFCFSEPLCNDLPSPLNKRAIFVGQVTDLYPASVEVYRPLFEEGRASKPAGAARQQLEREKSLIVKLWRGDIAEAELQAVQAAKSEESLRRASGLARFGRRVRLRVLE